MRNKERKKEKSSLETWSYRETASKWSIEYSRTQESNNLQVVIEATWLINLQSIFLS